MSLLAGEHGEFGCWVCLGEGRVCGFCKFYGWMTLVWLGWVYPGELGFECVGGLGELGFM